MGTQTTTLQKPREHSNFVEVDGSQLHYLEMGQGDPILFLHGIPTSSYLWRHIMPTLAKHGRCIAPDLIGMGFSDKPDIAYRIFDHIHYIDGLIAALDLDNITLVLHGWGSVVGFDFASRHPEKIKALAFYESHVRATLQWDMLSLPVQELTSMLQNKERSYEAVIEENYIIEQLLPSGAVDGLKTQDFDYYRKPFITPESRKVLWQYLQDLPLGNGPDDVVALIRHYSKWLQETPLPKLMFYAVPGFITPIPTVQWAKEHFPNLTLECLNDVMHFAQESMPELFAQKLDEWYLKLA